MKKVFSPLGVFILFTVGAFLSGFFGLWGETWFNNLFGRESKQYCDYAWTPTLKLEDVKKAAKLTAEIKLK